MRILMICSKFSLNKNDNWLTNELAEAYVTQGHHVQVVLIDWTTKNQKPYIHSSETNLNVLVLSPGEPENAPILFRRIYKWTLSSYFLQKEIKSFLSEQKFDLIIGFSPAVILMGIIDYCIHYFKSRAYFILWDFFPLHQQQMGIINNKFILFISHYLEQRAIKKYHTIGCMTEQCIEYLYANYQLNSAQRVEVLPVWGKALDERMPSQSEIRQLYNLPSDKNIAIFGGQLIPGRGIEDILDIAKMSYQNNDNILFLIIGSGPYEDYIKRSIIGVLKNVILLGRIPRNEYLQLLSACDIGLVCLTKELTAPSFPSKTIDYMRIGLPILASIAEGLDYAAFLVKTGMGLPTIAGQPVEFYKDLKKMVDMPLTERNSMGQRGKDYFYQNMEVNQVAKKILCQSIRT